MTCTFRATARPAFVTRTLHDAIFRGPVSIAPNKTSGPSTDIAIRANASAPRSAASAARTADLADSSADVCAARRDFHASAACQNAAAAAAKEIAIANNVRATPGSIPGGSSVVSGIGVAG